jgi:hypothetical protein
VCPALLFDAERHPPADAESWTRKGRYMTKIAALETAHDSPGFVKSPNFMVLIAHSPWETTTNCQEPRGHKSPLPSAKDPLPTPQSNH